MTDISAAQVHMIGIGGAGLSAIARVLLEQGTGVSGSDLVISPVAEALVREGALVYEGHDAAHVNGADLVVASSAIPDENVEIREAEARGIPVLRRPAFLARMMEGQRVVAVSGTHGKTTTTAMLATILLAAERDPTFIVGGVLADLGTNARSGSEPLFLIEADEYDRTFLSMAPEVAVITNVEHDHPDCYPTFGAFRAAFESFASLVPENGLLAVCGDDVVAREIGQRRADETSVRVFGLREGLPWRAEEVRPNFAGGVDFLAVHGQKTLGLVRLRVPGAHNASNAMAALVVADFLNVPFVLAREALTSFRGVARRFEVKGEAQGVLVVDDYAHHPTEIKATLRAARERFPDRRIWAVWQPHTYSRTRELMDAFARSFEDADRVIVLPIYAAREQDTLGVSAAEAAAAMEHPHVEAVASLGAAVEMLLRDVRAQDVVMTLGAGDGDFVGERLLSELGGRPGD